MTSKHNRYPREIDLGYLAVAKDAVATVVMSGAGYSGTLGDEYATVEQLRALDARKLSLSGGRMTGDLLLAGDPAADLGAASKRYVDGLQAMRVIDANGLPMFVVQPAYLRLGDSLRPGITYTDDGGLRVADLALDPKPGWEWSWYLETPATGHAAGAIYQARRACRLAMARGNCKTAPSSNIAIKVMRGFDYFYLDQLVTQLPWPAGVRTIAVDGEALRRVEEDGDGLEDGPEDVLEAIEAMNIEANEWVCLDFGSVAGLAGLTLQLYFEVR